MIAGYFYILNDANLPEDRLGKVRPFIDHLIQSFPKHWTPHHEISIDKPMIDTGCRVYFIQYIPKNPVKFDGKNWSAIVCNFQIYTGKNDKTRQAGLSHRVILHFADPYLNKFHRLFMENFYSSPALYEELYEKKTLACGSASQDRKGICHQLI